MATLPKSDSTTSLSSLISIGNESKISEIAVRTVCIICLGEEGTLKNSVQNKVCTCVYHYHEDCLKTWHEKHSALCPICRQQSKYMRIKIPKDLTIWQKVLLGMAALAIVGFLVGLVVKLILKV